MAAFPWRTKNQPGVTQMHELLMAIATGSVFLFAGALIVFLFRCFLLLLRETFKGFEEWLGIPNDEGDDRNAKR